jgi:hypothetical protein
MAVINNKARLSNPMCNNPDSLDILNSNIKQNRTVHSQRYSTKIPHRRHYRTITNRIRIIPLKKITIQEPNKRRPILDCQRLNQYIQCEHFKMEGVPALRELLEKDDYMCKLDLKDAYTVVPIHP